MDTKVDHVALRDLVNAYNEVSATTVLSVTYTHVGVQEKLRAAVEALRALRIESLIAKAQQDNAGMAVEIKRNEQLIEQLRGGVDV